MLQIGGPALGEDFYDREDKLNEISKRIKNTNILITAPRRFGKTSLLREFERRMKSQGYTVLYLDVMHISSPDSFVHKLTLAAFDEIKIRKRFLDLLGKIFRSVASAISVEAGMSGASLKLDLSKAISREINSETWIDSGAEILKAIIESSEKTPVIVILDELPEAVSNMRRNNAQSAVKFLQWFRSVRQEISMVKFIVAGSTSFRRTVKGITGRDHYINDFYPIDIEGFSRKDSLEFLERAFKAESIQFSSEIGKKILDLVGEPYIPYFLALFVDILSKEFDRNASPEEILNSLEEIYWSKLLGSEGNRYFEDYRARLRTYYSDSSKAVEKILTETAGSEDGINIDLAKEIFRDAMRMDDDADDKFSLLLEDLKNDFYVKLEGKRLKIYSKLLKDWWRLNYE